MLSNCRACLESKQEMIPFDEEYIIYFNLLTNLDIQLCDSLPQQLCKCCFENITSFIKFREECLKNDLMLKNLDLPIKHIKEEILQSEVTLDNNIKYEYEELSPSYSDTEYCTNNDVDPAYNEIANDVIANSENLEDIKTDFLTEIETAVKRPRRKIRESRETKDKKIKKGICKSKNEFLCGICTEAFLKNNLQEHIQSHSNNNKCLICWQEFGHWTKLFAHRVVHLTSRREQFCHICFKRFYSPEWLEMHYKKEHCGIKMEGFQCTRCPRVFESEKLLRKHVSSVHSTKSYICDTCKKSFKTKELISRHQKMHLEPITYSCDMCDYTCSFMGSLRIHKLRKHAKVKFSCKKCYNVFRYQKCLDKHVCEQVYTLCPVCGKEMDAKKLRRHMAVHSTVCKYKCELCSKAYRSASALKVHVNKHKGIKDQACDFCPARFYSPTVLLKHRRIHTGEKPYVCDVCSKAFTGNNNLKVHMKVHGLFLINKKNSDESAQQKVNLKVEWPKK